MSGNGHLPVCICDFSHGGEVRVFFPGKKIGNDRKKGDRAGVRGSLRDVDQFVRDIMEKTTIFAPSKNNFPG